MHYYVTLTTKCNLKCVYCYGKAVEDIDSDFGGYEVDYSIPSEIAYGIDDLKRFLSRDPDATLVFYGGEPLLRIDKMKIIMDEVQAKRYILQTYGILLDRLEPKYANRLHTILVSIDGNEETTDRNRGKGTYRKVVENVKLLRRRGFKGEVIARMTINENVDVERQVKWLLFNKDCPFTSIHWQLDALFGKKDFERRNFKEWSEKVYNPQIRRLVGFWISHMERYGEVLRLYPFVGVMKSILTGESTKLRCGAGWTFFNIQTDGKLTPCPVMAGMKDFYLGDIFSTDPQKIRKVYVSSPCTECDLYSLCGGRCLYANVTKLWGERGFKLVCKTVENLIYTLKEAAPKVRKLIAEGKVSYSDFNYPKYNSCEIIP